MIALRRWKVVQLGLWVCRLGADGQHEIGLVHLDHGDLQAAPADLEDLCGQSLGLVAVGDKPVAAVVDMDNQQLVVLEGTAGLWEGRTVLEDMLWDGWAARIRVGVGNLEASGAFEFVLFVLHEVQYQQPPVRPDLHIR